MSDHFRGNTQNASIFTGNYFEDLVPNLIVNIAQDIDKAVTELKRLS